MQIVQQVLFVLCFAGAVWFFSKKVQEIRRNIFLGLKEDLTDNPSQRWKNMFLLALGQKKMFKNPLVAVLHLIVYLGFVIINIEVLEIVLDGVLGTHRLFLPVLGSLYSLLINSFELLAFGVLLACVIFLVRRNSLQLKRFLSNDLNGWPRSDANNILITEIVLMSLFLLMNATDRALQLNGAAHYADTGNFVLSGLLAPSLTGLSETSLIAIERSAWNDCFPEALEDWDYYLAVEKAAIADFQWRYLAIYEGSTLVAVAPAFTTQYRLDTTVSGLAKRFTERLARQWPGALELRLYAIGSPVAEQCSAGTASHVCVVLARASIAAACRIPLRITRPSRG